MGVSAPKVSVIIPAYNSERYIKKCLDSLIKQTLQDIEIICVNDGSTDNTGDILDEYSRMDDRIVVLHQSNSGQSGARNAGMNIAKGTFIGFVDSDDFIDVEMFETLYNSALKFNSDVVVSNLLLYINDTKEICPYRDIVRMFHLEREGVFRSTDNPDIVKFVGVWDKLYKRSFIEKYKLRYLEKKIYEDHLFSFQALILAERISVVSQPMYYYRKNSGHSITDMEKSSDKHKEDFLLITKTIRDFIAEHKVYAYFIKPFLEYQFEFALFHQSNIASRNFFEKFFLEMREMMLEDDYRIIEDSGLSRHKWYAERLKRNELKECYQVLRKQRISIYEL